jgi:hypothetical protein
MPDSIRCATASERGGAAEYTSQQVVHVVVGAGDGFLHAVDAHDELHWAAGLFVVVAHLRHHVARISVLWGLAAAQHHGLVLARSPSDRLLHLMNDSVTRVAIEADRLDPGAAGALCYNMWDGPPGVKRPGGQETKTSHAAGGHLGFRSNQFTLFIQGADGPPRRSSSPDSRYRRRLIRSRPRGIRQMPLRGVFIQSRQREQKIDRSSAPKRFETGSSPAAQSLKKVTLVAPHWAFFTVFSSSPMRWAMPRID